MLIKYDNLSSSLPIPDISSSVTLAPRLGYAINLLDTVITTLTDRQQQQKTSNVSATLAVPVNFDKLDRTQIDALRLEYRLLFSLEVLLHVKERTRKISHVSGIPEILLLTIPLIRTTSAQLFDVLPDCSSRLSEVSVHLGSIVLDSAFLTTAKFDFSQSNSELSALHDEVKLIVSSKLSKQYPNLDFFKLNNA